MPTVSRWRKMGAGGGVHFISQYQHHISFVSFLPALLKDSFLIPSNVWNPTFTFLPAATSGFEIKRNKINVWSSVQESHILGLRMAATGAQHSQQKHANILEVTLTGITGSGDACFPSREPRFQRTTLDLSSTPHVLQGARLSNLETWTVYVWGKRKKKLYTL